MWHNLEYSSLRWGVCFLLDKPSSFVLWPYLFCSTKTIFFIAFLFIDFVGLSIYGDFSMVGSVYGVDGGSYPY